MNELKAKYISWLRQNGERKIKYELCNDSGGVCAEAGMLELALEMGEKRISRDIDGNYMDGGLVCAIYAPEWLLEKFDVEGYGIAELNDNYNLSFEQIAKMLENNWDENATHPDYWDCDCAKNFQHKKADVAECDICGAVESEQPDSRVTELMMDGIL